MYLRKLLYILLALVSFASCASKEDKANRLIKDYMFKHLHDYKSYEVVETTVDSMFNSPLSDPECVKYALDAMEHMNKEKEYEKEADFDDSSMDIWSDGWSAHSRAEYDKAFKSWIGHKISAMQEKVIYLYDAKGILERTKALDGKEHTGWMVTHSFRSNTLGGNSSLGNRLFLVDKDFKNILATYDSEDGYDKAMDNITGVILTFNSAEQVDSIIGVWKDAIKDYEESLKK